jgi:ribonuclease HI
MDNAKSLSINVLQWNCRSVIPKKPFLRKLLADNDVRIFALSETHLSSTDVFTIPNYNIVRNDRDDGYGGVMVGVRKDIPFEETINDTISNCELAGVLIKDEQGRELNILSGYCAPNCRLNSAQIGNVLRNLSGPLILVGDFNAHSQSWGCHDDNTRASAIIELLDDFNMVVINDGSITRIAAPPRQSSAIDLTLCSSELSLDIVWKVLSDPAGSDHLPILSSLSSFHVTKKSFPFQNYTENISWDKFSRLVDEGINLISVDLSLEQKYDLFVDTLKRAVEHSRPNINSSRINHKSTSPPWWDVDCIRLDTERMASFREFRYQGGSEKYEKYIELEDRLKNLCDKKETESWRKYCSSLSSRSQMSEVWKMAKKYRDPFRSTPSSFSPNTWLSDFADKIAPPFVAPYFEITDCSQRFSYLADEFSVDEILAAIQLSNNSSPGLDGIKFTHLKKLSEPALLFLLAMYNEIFRIGCCPKAWRETKVVAILKPGKQPNESNSYRPISLLSCIRKLFEKMICTRLDHWAEKFEVISASQYGFRKGKGTRDCLSLLSTDIRISFEEKKNTLASFLDVSGAYDNVLLNVLCENLSGLQLPLEVVRIIWHLLKEKDLHFVFNGDIMETRIGRKGLPQGSVLSPLLYNLLGSSIDHIIPIGVSILQYADDIVIYVSGHILLKMQKQIQKSLNAISDFLSDLGLNLSCPKSETVLFTRKSSQLSPPLYINNNPITISKQFKYLGVIFDRGLNWNAHAGYIQKRCKMRINFMKSIAGTSWGSHPDVLLLLYKGLVRSVLEYGCFCFAEMAETHIKKLERIQWRGLRIALGLMQSTHTGTVEILSGIEPLDLRFSYLNSKLLVNAFSKSGHPLKQKLEKLSDLASRKLPRDFPTVSSLGVTLTESYTQFSLPSLLKMPVIVSKMQESLAEGSRETTNSLAPMKFNAIVREHFPRATLIYTDGSKSGMNTGFGVYSPDLASFGYRLREPTSIFTAEVQAINHAIDLISSNPPGEYLICTDSLSSIEAIKSRKISVKTNLGINWIKETIFRLEKSGYCIQLMWIPSHCGIRGNESVDNIAKESSFSLNFANVGTTPSDFYPQLRALTISKWQKRWEMGEMGRYTFSIYPKVELRPWFSGLTYERNIITSISRLISNHNRTKSHLNRIGIVSTALCSCGDDYESVDHILWRCSLYQATRITLMQQMDCPEPPTAIRDLLGQRKWKAVQACVSFLLSIITI